MVRLILDRQTLALVIRDYYKAFEPELFKKFDFDSIYWTGTNNTEVAVREAEKTK